MSQDKQLVDKEQGTADGPETFQPGERKAKMIRWFKRLGVAGFLFFLGKGLIWIAVFYGGLRFIGCGEN
jgi:hypothetical protein